MKKLVLFGAGVYAKMYKSLLDYLGMSFDYFTDNDRTKFGTVLYGKPVISPESLVSLDCNIIISCSHGEQIKKQLADMGIFDKLIGLEDICDQFKMKIENTPILGTSVAEDKLSVIVDMYEGIGWGGTEMWAASVAEGLCDNGYPVELFGSREQLALDEKYECMVERFPTEGTIECMVNKMRESLPFVLLNNFSGCAYLASVMLKMQYPDMVHIINVIHNDNRSLFQAHMMFGEWADRVICVSDKIRKTMISDYGLDESKVYFKEQPIEIETGFSRLYDSFVRPLRMGYAARLVKQQKRADLFPEIISKLEALTQNYQIEIAGDGEYFSVIREFVQNNKLEERVILKGRIDKGKMSDFWKRQDVYLNFSEYEGTSLSMLEAMSYACVPVVTDVSGVSEFVEAGKNGYICEVGDLDGICKAICHLESHRDLLESYGEICKSEIASRCKKEDYIKFVQAIIDDVEGNG